MAKEPDSNLPLSVINWPTKATSIDIARVRGYVAEGFLPDVSAANVLVEQTGSLRDLQLAQLREGFVGTALELARASFDLDYSFNSYQNPAVRLLKARDIETRGPEMPVLLNPKLDPNLDKLTPIDPDFNADVLRALLISQNFRQWQDEVQLLQQLQTLGPLGLVDLEARELIKSFRKIHSGKELGKTVELGRRRFHQLYEAI